MMPKITDSFNFRQEHKIATGNSISKSQITAYKQSLSEYSIQKQIIWDRKHTASIIELQYKDKTENKPRWV